MVVKKLLVAGVQMTYTLQRKPNGSVVAHLQLPTGDEHELTIQELEYDAMRGVLSFICQGQLLQVQICKRDDVYAVLHQGTNQVVLVEEPTKKPAARFVPATLQQAAVPALSNANPDHVHSPLAGRVTRVMVVVGQAVKQGQALLLIESMKMENELCAPSDGYIKTISIKDGDVVQPKQVVIMLSREGEGHAEPYREHGSTAVSYRGPCQ